MGVVVVVGKEATTFLCSSDSQDANLDVVPPRNEWKDLKEMSLVNGNQPAIPAVV